MVSGLNSLEYRMLPPKKRIHNGLEKISKTLSDSTQIEIKIDDDEHKWYCIFGNEKNRTEMKDANNPFLDFSIGMLQGYLSWASGGKSYPIQKNENQQVSFVIEIEKKAMS